MVILMGMGRTTLRPDLTGQLLTLAADDHCYRPCEGETLRFRVARVARVEPDDDVWVWLWGWVDGDEGHWTSVRARGSVLPAESPVPGDELLDLCRELQGKLLELTEADTYAVAAGESMSVHVSQVRLGADPEWVELEGPQFGPVDGEARWGRIEVRASSMLARVVGQSS